MLLVDRITKKYEWLSNSHRYPNSMIGRTQRELALLGPADILVFAAHADDESLALGTILCRHRANQEKIVVVFTTNGRGGSGWKTRPSTARKIANMRLRESRDALSRIEIPPTSICCLGFPDGGLYRYIHECFTDIQTIIQQVRPNRIYAHSMDGGHVDHDVTNVCVSAACLRNHFDEVYEWAEYNPYSHEGDFSFRFPGETEPTPVIPNKAEKDTKNQMLASYKSQLHVLQRYEHKYENVRKVSSSKVAQPECTLYDARSRLRVIHAIRGMEGVLNTFIGGERTENHK